MKRTDEQLEAYAKEHIFYEIEMLFRTHECYSAASVFLSVVIANALYESFMMHARLLDSFLRSSGRDDDVKASDYIKGRSLTNESPPWRRDANKHVAHLSWERIPQGGADLSNILREIVPNLQLFYRSLPVERQQWFAVIPRCFPLDEGTA